MNRLTRPPLYEPQRIPLINVVFFHAALCVDVIVTRMSVISIVHKTTQ